MVSQTNYCLLLMLALPLLFGSCSQSNDPAPVSSAGEAIANGVVEPEAATPATVADRDPYPELADGEIKIHRARAGDLDPDGWCLAESTLGDFSVMLPGTFQDLTIKATNKEGMAGAMHTVKTLTPKGVEFSVLQTETWGIQPEMIDFVEIMTARFDQLGAAIERSEVEVAGLEATKLRVTAKGVVADMVFVSIPKNHFMIAVQHRAADANYQVYEADAERFFQSFELQRNKAN